MWLAANPNSGPASVDFTPGATYVLESNQLDEFGNLTDAALIIKGLNGSDRLQLRGNGATIVNEMDLSTTFRILNSENIDVLDLTFDVYPLPYFVGEVTRVNSNCNGFITVLYESGKSLLAFPPDTSNDPENPQHWGGLLDQVVIGRSEPGTKSIYRATNLSLYATPMGVEEYRMRIVTPPSDFCDDFQVGDTFTYQHRQGGVTIQLRNSSDIEVRDCTVYGSSSMFVNTDDTHDLRVIDCDVRIAPGRNRSINGDGVHVKRGTSILIQGCFFEGLMDDAINITEVDGFAIVDNIFVNKRRFAIVLDGDDQLSAEDICDNGNFGPLNSRNGLIELNAAVRCGASFIAHQGGDYSSLTIRNNRVRSNNTEDSSWQNHRVQILTTGPTTFALAAAPGTNGWTDGDAAVLESDVESTDRIWHINGYRCFGQHFIYHRASQDANATHYLGGAPGPLVGPNDPTVALSGRVSVAAPEMDDDEFWIVEPVDGSDDVPYDGSVEVRFRHSLTGNYLTAITASVGSPVELLPFDATDRGQLWVFRDLDD